MKHLFLVDGAAGTGKTDMMKRIKEKYEIDKNAKVIIKYTTRKKREEEKNKNLLLDLNFISESEFDVHQNNPGFYSYRYSTERYGFYKNDIDEALLEYSNVFVIVRDHCIIEKIKKDYPKVSVIPVLVHSDHAKIIERLEKEGYDEDAINFRLRRMDLVYEDYLRHPSLYNEIIINSSDRRDFNRLIDHLIKKYSEEPHDTLMVSGVEKIKIIEPLIGFKDKMRKKMEKYPYEKNIFIMMKYRKNNKIVYERIKPIIEANGFNCVRADQDEWNITNNVYNPLAVLNCCKYGIALFDEPEEGNNFSPNVAYELGMMHLQGKHCLILRHEDLSYVPFDLIKNIHHKYSRDFELEEHVNKWINNIKNDEEYWSK